MATSRLTQFGVGGRAYEYPVDIELTEAAWGWQSYALTVDYEKPATSRLGSYAVSLPAYVTTIGTFVNLEKQDWGWTAYPVTVDYADPELIDLTQADWGWTPQNLTICAQDRRGYYGSFNGDVWPSCTFNEHVFGPRTHVHFEFDRNDWGWASYAIDVSFEDPIDVGLTLANWGYFAYPLSVSYVYDVQLQILPWGWQAFPISVEQTYDVDLNQKDWGWRPHPLGVSHGTEVGLTIATYGWQSFPLSIEVPATDVRLRQADWGWQSLPIEVKQTQLLPSDIEAIAEAVWQKMQAEGAVQQWLETWQRQGCDSAYPQTIRHPDNGGNVEVGGMTIEQTETSEGDVVQTRQ